MSTQRVRDTEKQLIFARRNPDGSYEVFAKTLVWWGSN